MCVHAYHCAQLWCMVQHRTVLMFFLVFPRQSSLIGCYELQPTNCWDQIVSLRHPSKFQQVSHLAFVTAATSLTGGQQNFARCLAVSSAGTLYIHFRGLLPPDRILPVENSLYVQVSHSSILPALLHGMPAVGVSQTLRHGTRNGIMELSQRAPPIFGMAAITYSISLHSKRLGGSGYHLVWR